MSVYKRMCFADGRVDGRLGNLLRNEYMKKPTPAEIEKQKVHRSLEGKQKVAPIPTLAEEAPIQHKETDAERRERWNHEWGETVSDTDCKKLDQTYDMIAEEYRPNITKRLELNLRDLAKIRLLRDRAIEEGNSSAVKQYTDSIDKIMASESMKAGDVKPVEALRPDALIDRLEKKGVTLMSQEEVARYINGDKGKYRTSIDIVDFIMLKWMNTFRNNNGESELGMLPKSLQVEDLYGELQPRITDREADAMADLGEIVPPREK